MPQVETLPQSIADAKTIVLKPRLDQGDLRLIAEKIKPSIFARFGFKPKLENVRLLASETYFEPYLIIAGKYVLDYCRKHVFEVNVKETTTKIFVAGQEFKSEQSDPKLTNKVVKMTGEEHAHHERQGYYILDRVKREIPPEKLPISPFIIQKDSSILNSSFKSIHISDETQIEFLKAKIAQRPADVAEIIREIFDITDRTIAYYPMYQLTFENVKNRKDATVTVDGITGEIMLNGTKKLAVKTVLAFDQNAETQLVRETAYGEKQTEPILSISQPEATNNVIDATEEEKTIKPAQLETEETPYEAAQAEPLVNINAPDTTDDTNTGPKYLETMVLGFPAIIHGKVLASDAKVEVVVGDVEIPSGTNIDKTLVIKGTLRIGSSCRARGKLKVLKDVIVGADTIIDGDIVSGGNIYVGPRSLIAGAVKAAGLFEIEENAVVEGIFTRTTEERIEQSLSDKR